MRIANEWNNLPFSVVTAPSVKSFKNRVDKHSASQELRYDWEAESSGTGNKAELNFELFEFTIIIAIWEQKHFTYAHNIR